MSARTPTKVPTKVAVLLRAVNIGGNRIKMVDLRDAFVRDGYADAITHIQTGNVIFVTDEPEAATVRRAEALIASSTGLTIRAVVRTAAEMAATVASNPFLATTGESDRKQLYVSFLGHAPDAEAVARLQATDFNGDTFEVVGRDLYLRYLGGAGTTKLTNAVIERKLGVIATARNWNVTTTLATLTAS